MARLGRGVAGALCLSAFACGRVDGGSEPGGGPDPTAPLSVVVGAAGGVVEYGRLSTGIPNYDDV